MSLPPPMPPRRPVDLERSDGTTSTDPWYWLRDRDDPAVLEHLRAENAHTTAMLAPLEGLTEQVFTEIRGRVAEDDASAPVFVPPFGDAPHGWVYHRRTLAGAQYAIHARRAAPDGVTSAGDLPDELRRAVDPLAPPDDEVVLLDENEEARGHDHFALGAFAVSPDQHLVAEAVDVTGDEVYAIRVRDLRTGQVVDESVQRAATSVAWFDDAGAFLYTVPDDAHRPHEVRRHVIGTGADADVVVHTEPDERFWLGLGRTRSGRWIAIQAGSRVTSEWHLADARDATATPRRVVEKVDGVEVDLDHHDDHLYLLHNADGAVDFQLSVADVHDPARAGWRTMVPHRPGVRLEGVAVFEDHLVIAERTEATTRLRVLAHDGGEITAWSCDDDTGTIGLGPNPDFRASTLRVVQTSLTRPVEVLDVDLATGERTLVKRQDVRGGHDPADYQTWREWATAPDGTRIPISIVRRADLDPEVAHPCLLYGYGAYEISMDAAFSIARLSLLDRGMVFAIAHVRGGGEMGRAWYEQGRLRDKGNTFTDFIACAQHLIERGITAADRLAMRGGSAGGLLIGAVLNLRPESFAVAVAEVPFVDVLTTMSDPSIPLTVIEYDEWGNPSDPVDCAAIGSWSPYDNVVEAVRPPVLVTAGLNDPRVQYWEPVKWVARLRETALDASPVLLRCELGAGHGGRSGRYDAWRDEAEVLAFVLDRTGAVD
ncbi:MAG: S9 family peptidase [Nitriliruptoraceae bacterium]